MFKFNFRDLYKITTKEKLTKATNRFGIGVCLILLITLISFVYCRFQTSSIGVVNITGIVDKFVQAEAKNNLLPEELKKRVQIFGTSLEKVLHDISVKKRVVLMPSEAVIAGAKDYTQEVQKLLLSMDTAK